MTSLPRVLAHHGAESREAPCPPRVPPNSPEAVPVVQLAVGQVTLHQVHVLLAGRTRAAGGPVGALL